MKIQKFILLYKSFFNNFLFDIKPRFFCNSALFKKVCKKNDFNMCLPQNLIFNLKLKNGHSQW